MQIRCVLRQVITDVRKNVTKCAREGPISGQLLQVYMTWGVFVCLHFVYKSRKLLFLYSILFRNIMLSIHSTISKIGRIINQTITGTTGMNYKVFFHGNTCFIVQIFSRPSRTLEFLSFSRTCRQLDISLSLTPSLIFKHLTF